MVQPVSRPVNTRTKGQHFTAGLVSGISSAVLLQPLDLLKTRVQQSTGTSLRSSVRGALRSPVGNPNVWALWRGTIPSTLRTGFGSALYFTLLNTLRQHAVHLRVFRDRASPALHSSQLPILSNTANLFTGATARILAGLALMPLTVLKVRFESNMYSYKTMWSAAQDIHRTSGPRGFFSGFGATAIRDGPYAGMYVLFYEALKKRLSRLSMVEGEGCERVKDATLINFTSAVLAGGTCSLISNPFDAIKTRIQLEPQSYTNIVQACRKMVVAEGVGSLFDGLALRMTKKALSSALAWTVYEELIRIQASERIGSQESDRL